MSKFHEEFFRQTEGEDELVMKCVKEDNMNVIIEQTSLQLSKSIYNKPSTKEVMMLINEFEDMDGDKIYRDAKWGANDYGVILKRKFKARVIHNYTGSSTKYEREVLCKSNNSFIIGYADLLFHVRNETYYSDVVDEETGLNVSNHVYGNLDEYTIIIEVKPNIKDTSAVLRQIKTYMDILRTPLGAIVSYSDLSPDLIASLNHENVAYIKMERE